MSKLGATALAVAVGYLLFRLLVGSAKLLYLLCKIAVLLPIALLALAAGGNVRVSREKPLTAPPAPPLPASEPVPANLVEPHPPSAATGDWRQDQETLKRLLAEGKIKTS